MARRHVLYLAASVFLGLLVIWKLRPAPPTLNRLMAQAEFSRPAEIDTQKAKDFSISINGVDWLHGTPLLETGKGYPCSAKLPDSTRGSAEAPIAQWLYIMPRLSSQDETAFDWVDVSVDMILPYNNGKLDGIDKLRLAAGDYLVRFYLKNESLDFQTPSIPEIIYLGDSRLKVLASERGIAGHVPLSNPKQLIPVQDTPILNTE